MWRTVGPAERILPREVREDWWRSQLMW